MPHHVFIVEDHPFMRDIQARLIDLQPDLAVCGTAATVDEALAALPAGADLVLLDLSLGKRSGLDLLATIRRRWPDLPCIVLSGQPALEYEAAARAAGAAGYVEKGNAASLLNAIHAVLTPS
ncbi:MAG TPA: response regulator transcription factor [Rubricoccaceae bacterium]|nr:response regulator transcription factor [Rubricoccaceae bacterium]